MDGAGGFWRDVGGIVSGPTRDGGFWWAGAENQYKNMIRLVVTNRGGRLEFFGS